MIKGKGNRAEQRRRYKKKHPDKVKAARKRYRQAHPEKVKAERARYKKDHPEKAREYMRRRNKAWRLEVLTHYSNGLLRCSACGEGHIEFLEIDHINGGGNKHKKELGNKGKAFYKWLIDQGLPAGYQVLCSNCNMKKVKDAARIRGEAGTTEQKKYYRRSVNLKADIFSHYMIDGKIKCSCPGCNVTDPDLLCIDHLNGDGAEHRKQLEMYKNACGFRMYMWIKRNHYPPDFRLLCHNCNQALGKYGYCPHEKNYSIFNF